MNINLIEDFIQNKCLGSNMEFFESIDLYEDEYIGIEICLVDYLNKGADFESDIECLLMDLDENLDANIFFSHSFEEYIDIDDFTGDEFETYSCFIKIYQNI